MGPIFVSGAKDGSISVLSLRVEEAGGGVIVTGVCSLHWMYIIRHSNTK